jgi:hypothetical protein
VLVGSNSLVHRNQVFVWNSPGGFFSWLERRNRSLSATGGAVVAVLQNDERGLATHRAVLSSGERWCEFPERVPENGADAAMQEFG